MTRILSILLAIAVSAPAWAMDLTSMTPEEREIFREEVRAYLLDHPEVIFEAVEVYERRQSTAQAANDEAIISANAQQIFADGYSWVGGNPDGDLTVVEFVDYRCGYCKRAFGEVKELIESDGNIRFVLKEFPILGEESTQAARFAIAVKHVAGPDAYKLAHDMLMSMRAGVTNQTLARIANNLGLNADQVFSAMQSAAVQHEINANYALARTLGINGTPSFVVQSEMLRGYVPLEGMREIVARIRGG